MSTIYRILHLSDLHWDSSSAEDQNLIIRKFEADLQTMTKEKRVDVVVFSGDLVAKGQDAHSFDTAKHALFDPMAAQFGISKDDILICPGNHDVDRKTALSQTYLEAGLRSELQDTHTLNRHIDQFFQLPIEQDDANLRLKHYFEFTRANFNTGATLKSNYVDCIIKNTPIGNIGFALFNSAWRSTGAGEAERNQLLIAERTLDKAADQLRACDLRIAVIHHPMDWLALWNQKSIKTPLFITFDLLLFGHVHETMPTLVEDTIGECLFAQGGTLYLHREYYNGYQIIDVSQDETVNFDFSLRTWYDYPRREFGPAENICALGKKRFQLRSTIDASKRLTINELLGIQTAIDEMANAHFRALQVRDEATFDDSFTCPPLSRSTQGDLLRVHPREYKSNLIALPEILKDDGIIVFSGARESGKTSIAWRIAKDAMRAPDRVRIPIVIDFSLLRKYDSLDRLVRRHITVLNLDIPASKILGSHRCLFIVDNVSLAYQEKVDRLKVLLRDNSEKHDWCIFLDEVELLSSKNIINEFGASKPPIFIQPFGRSEIRSLVTKISASEVGGDDRTGTIVTLINDNDLPRNPYIVTLLNSVLASVAVDLVINEATLLDKMIDLLLNKQDPTNIIRSSKDFAGLNIILEEIAKWVSADEGYLPENELLRRLAAYLTACGIQESASDLLHHFVGSGILERLGEDVCFRYRSFRSYFFARYAARNKDFAPRLLDELAIIKYGKEFSLLCDLSRKDANLLDYLEVIILELQPPIYDEIDKSKFFQSDLKGSADDILDECLENISGGPQTLSKIDERHDLHDRARAALTSQLEELSDATDAEEPTEEDKERIKQVMRFAGYTQAWVCWGRAITSLDFVELSVRKPSLKKLLDHWVKFASLVSEAGHAFTQDLINEAQNEGKAFSHKVIHRMEYLARVQFPLNAAVIAFAHIGASSIFQVLIETFDELDLQSPEAMGATCMLIRHRPPGWSDRVKKYIDVNVRPQEHSIKRYFLLEAFYQEYYFRYLSPRELNAIEGLIAILLNKAGFVNAKTESILRRFEQNRPKIELITRDLRR
jgi:predicted MPP superfamily phosphohydrolase